MSDKVSVNSTGIRPYGPGKFSTMLDSYVYQVSLDVGCDDEIGSVDEGGWYGMMQGGRAIFAADLELTAAERDMLDESAGVIVSEDSNGFVSVEYYATATELHDAWHAIEEEHENQCQ